MILQNQNLKSRVDYTGCEKNLNTILKKVAVHIKTDVWNEIISALKKRGWLVTSKYYGFDAGVDHDFLVLRKGMKKITFGWSNWFEGEIKCSDALFTHMESELKISFEYGEPKSLKNTVSFLDQIKAYFKL